MSMLKPAWCDKDPEGQLAWELFNAAMAGDVESLSSRLEFNRDLARLEYWYTPPIYFAVRSGHLGATKLLWNCYRPPNLQQLLQLAIDREHPDVARFLRERMNTDPQAGQNTKLHLAVQQNDARLVLELVSEQPELLSCRDEQGRTPLHVALSLTDSDLASILISHSGSAGREALDYQDIHGLTPLHAAVRYRRHTSVDQLIQAGALLDIPDFKGFRPIHHAYWRNTLWDCRSDAPELAAFILGRGARDSITLAAARGDIEQVTRYLDQDRSLVNDGDTLEKRPISAAVERRHSEIVDLLLEQGANPTLREGQGCPHGSALMAASVNDDCEMARKLLDAGAEPNGGMDSSGSPASRAISDAMRGLMYRYGGRPRDIWGFIQAGDLETVAAILAYQPDPFQSASGEHCSTPFTAIISGCKRKSERGESTDAHWAMLYLFLKRGFRVPPVLTECRGYLWEVPAMTRVLLEHGMDPNLPNWQRQTPLHDIAGRCGSIEAELEGLELAEMLLEFGANIDARDEEYLSTPLGVAARVGYASMVEFLLSRGAKTNLPGDEPWAAPLAWAEKRSHSEIVRLLRASGAM